MLHDAYTEFYVVQVHTQGSTPPQFVGRIRQIHEERNSVDFDGYSLNFGEMVKPCR